MHINLGTESDNDEYNSNRQRINNLSSNNQNYQDINGKICN